MSQIPRDNMVNMGECGEMVPLPIMDEANLRLDKELNILLMQKSRLESLLNILDYQTSTLPDIESVSSANVEAMRKQLNKIKKKRAHLEDYISRYAQYTHGAQRELVPKEAQKWVENELSATVTTNEKLERDLASLQKERAILEDQLQQTRIANQSRRMEESGMAERVPRVYNLEDDFGGSGQAEALWTNGRRFQ